MKDIHFKYKFSDDYNPTYINGAHGGVNPTGELIVNFYLERTPLPYEEIRSLDENGQLSAEGSYKPDSLPQSYIRYIETGIVLNLKTAEELHYWLGENIKVMKGK